MYRTVSKAGEFSQTINKSRFIAVVSHIESESDARALIEKEKKKYPDARHCCWAYILGENSENMRYGDDGEPQGTAGLPMLEVLKKKNITNVLVTVTRYFGGILLGTGGLTRAYSSSCAGAAENAAIATMLLCKTVTVTLDYPLFSRLKLPIEKFDGAKCESTEFGQNVNVTLTVKSDKCDEFCGFLTQLSGGRAQMLSGEPFFFPWEG